MITPLNESINNTETLEQELAIELEERIELTCQTIFCGVYS